MTKRRKWIALLAVLYFLCTLGLYHPMKRIWNEFLGKEKEIAYTGDIQIWHITGGNTGKLKDGEMLSRFEKDHFGIFIKTMSLSEKQAKEKLAQGERPDLITYEPGFFERPKEELEPLEPLDIPFGDGGRLSGETYAYPVSYDEYTFLVNEDLLYEWELEPPALMDLSFFLEQVGGKTKEGVKPIAYAGKGAVFHTLLAWGEALPGEPAFADLQAFSKGEIAVLVCSKWKAATTELDLPGHNLYDLGHFTDQVRYISVPSFEVDEKRLQCSKALAKLYLEERGQKAAAAAGFSVTLGSDQLPRDEAVRLLSAFDRLPEDKAAFDKESAKEWVEKLRDAVITFGNMV